MGQAKPISKRSKVVVCVGGWGKLNAAPESAIVSNRTLSALSVPGLPDGLSIHVRDC